MAIGEMKEEMENLWRRNEERKESGNVERKETIDTRHALSLSHALLTLYLCLSAAALEKTIANKKKTLESLPTEGELKEKIDSLKKDFEATSLTHHYFIYVEDMLNCFLTFSLSNSHRLLQGKRVR